MQARVLQEDFLKGLTHVSRFVSTRAQLPILSNILISSSNNAIKLASTNLELGLVVRVPAKIEEQGSITVPARTINEIVANFPAGQIDLKTEGEHLLLNNVNSKVSLSGMLPSEFPNVPDSLEKTDFTLSPEKLLSIRNQVVFAAAEDDTRPVLTGILFDFKQEELQTAATDGFRLSSKLFRQKSQGEDKRILVSARLIDDLCRLLGDSKENVSVAILEKTKQILFSAQNFVLTGRILEGEFPDFERIIPNSYKHKAITSKEELLRGVRTVGVLARESSNIIKLKIEKGRIVLVSESQAYGNEEVTVEAKTEGGEVEIAFNYKFLQDFLNSVSYEEVSLETENATAPAVFKTSQDKEFFHLIMPIRLQT